MILATALELAQLGFSCEKSAALLGREEEQVQTAIAAAAVFVARGRGSPTYLCFEPSVLSSREGENADGGAFENVLLGHEMGELVDKEAAGGLTRLAMIDFTSLINRLGYLIEKHAGQGKEAVFMQDLLTWTGMAGEV